MTACYTLELFQTDLAQIHRAASLVRAEPSYQADNCDLDSVVTLLLNHLELLDSACLAEFLRQQLTRLDQDQTFTHQYHELWRQYLKIVTANSDLTTLAAWQFLGTITEAAERLDCRPDHYQDQADLLRDFIIAGRLVAKTNDFSPADSLWIDRQLQRLQWTLERTQLILESQD